MRDDRSSVTVVIVTYQSSGTVEKTLAPLRQLCRRGLLRCVVVDNASTDGTLEILRGEADWLELIESRENVGYGRGCNLGWPSSMNPYVLFLNPDAVLDASALEILVDFMDGHPRAGIAAPALLDPGGQSHRAGGLTTPKNIIRGQLRLAVEQRERFEPGSAPFRTNWLSGAVQLYRTQLLRELGGFDSRFFMYFEETDLGVRALESGWELWAVPQAVGQHAVAASARATGQKLVNNAISDHFFRSRFYYLVKHHGWLSAVAAELLDVLTAGLRGGVLWATGRDPSRQFARLRAPIFRFPHPTIRPRFSKTGASERSPRVTIRNAGEADEPEIVELLLKAFHRWPEFEIPVSATDHLHWKLRSDPIASRLQWVSEIDGRIVGTIFRVVRRVRVKGQDCLSREIVDAAVDPQYERQRVHSAMANHAQESRQASEFHLGYWYSTNPKLRRRSTRQERAPLANPIRVLQKPYRTRAIVVRRRKKHGGRLPVPLAVLRIKLGTAFKRLGRPPYWRPAKRAWSITTLERFDDRIDGFFDEAARPFDFIVVRSSEYMNWRYCDPAAGRFTVRAAEEQGRLLGYLVFKIAEGEGYIADLLALPGRIDVVRPLIEDALRLFREAGVDLVTCWMISRHPYNGILRRYGFIDSRRDVGFGYQPVSLDDRDLEFLREMDAKVHITHGDSDWI